MSALRGWGGAHRQKLKGFYQDGIRAAMSISPFADPGIDDTDITAYIVLNGSLTDDLIPAWN